MIKTTVTKRGQTVIPSAIRKKFNIGRDSSLIWTTDGKVIMVIPVAKDPIRSLRGFSEGSNLLTALLKKRQEDKSLE